MDSRGDRVGEGDTSQKAPVHELGGVLSPSALSTQAEGGTLSLQEARV